MGKEGFFTAEQLAARFSSTVQTIKQYSDIGLLNAFYFDGETCYTSTAFIRLEIIQKGKKLGFSLAEIKAIIDETSDR